MATITFPNVPNVAGVPDLKRAAYAILQRTGLTGIIQNADQFGLLDAYLALEWGIYKDGSRVIIPDAFIGMEYRGKQVIASHPVEQGSFSSYNKVAVPYDIKVVLACSGAQNIVRQLIVDYPQKDEFLAKLESMKASLDLYTIATPDASYVNANLVEYNYGRYATNGATMIKAELYFREVQVKSATTVGTMTTVSASSTTDSQTTLIGTIS